MEILIINTLIIIYLVSSLLIHSASPNNQIRIEKDVRNQDSSFFSFHCWIPIKNAGKFRLYVHDGNSTFNCCDVDGGPTTQHHKKCESVIYKCWACEEIGVLLRCPVMAIAKLENSGIGISCNNSESTSEILILNFTGI